MLILCTCIYTNIQVAIEAMERKRDDLVTEVEREKKDLVKLQLLLQGSISAQVNNVLLIMINYCIVLLIIVSCY